MAMTIQSGVKGMILAAQGEAFNQEKYLLKGYADIHAQNVGLRLETFDAKRCRWKGVGHFRKTGGVHDTFHVSNLKKCLADASLHVPLDEIKVDKTLCFVEEPVEIMDREIKSLKRSKISLVKVR
ncbi:hypothetical protein Tco_0750996 [Tanacetum coccineum]|uniref:Reverse transcriptase domain-containing protein n=1 Tax=Tanacetum coccineum TaxID=301880 RepID=A0ABQ4Z3R3_9ASTR